MAIARLTKRTVDQLAPEPKPYFVFDEDLTGFGVRVGPSGSKSWIVEYRPGAGGRSAPKRRVTLGSTLKLTPDQARREARLQLAGVQLGSDPAANRKAERASPTLGELIDSYMSDEVRPKRAAGTATLYAVYFDKHVKPVLGGLKAHQVKHSEIARLHRAIGRDRKPTANRVVKALSAVFTYSEKNDLTPKGFNPAKGVDLFEEEGRDRYLTGDELQRLGSTLRLAETTGLPWEVDEAKTGARHAPKKESRIEVYSPFIVAAFRLLLFTGCRLREILHLRWTEVDFERGVLFLPTSKTGRKTIVLGGAALEILSTLPRGSAYVIAGAHQDKPRSDLKRPWQRITEHAGLGSLRIHDLRHSFASVGAGSGMGLPIVGKLLGHSQPSTTARYAHLDADPLRRAANAIGATIATAMERTPSAKAGTEEDGI